MKQISWDAEVIGPWVCQRTGGVWHSGQGTALGKLIDGNLVAGIIYDNYNEVNLSMHIAADDGWADKYFLGVIFQYPFCGLGVRMVTAPICSSNHKCIRLVEHMGFVQEGKLRGATSKGDLLLYVMRKENCKYLRGKYGKCTESRQAEAAKSP